MKLAIHNSQSGFHPRWVNYCKQNDIPFKLVDCYSNDIINQLSGCDALMWHPHHFNPKDILISKQILFALEHTGLIVFPNFRTSWHFDDKVAQKYLLERIGAPLVPSYVFYDRNEALAWINSTTFPKVFKLRGGAGSVNVKLITSATAAKKIVKKAFGKGFPKYDAWASLKERIYKFRKGNASFSEVLKGIIRFFYAPAYARLDSNEVGYVYFQEFIPNNDSDIRIIVIDGKAFGLKRFVRDNDFRASGSGDFAFDKGLFSDETLRIAFNISRKLDLQVAVLDFVYNQDNKPLIVELSYGYSVEAYDSCPGYWDESLKWHEEITIKEDWMVDLVLKQISQYGN